VIAHLEMHTNNQSWRTLNDWISNIDVSWWAHSDNMMHIWAISKLYFCRSNRWWDITSSHPHVYTLTGVSILLVIVCACLHRLMVLFVSYVVTDATDENFDEWHCVMSTDFLLLEFCFL